ncbi:MAG TPA: PEGA domain-containing protein [Rectinemataceae bacterium]|nr:PEGA domain-containing protein [Rectinemataceae bacterium]
MKRIIALTVALLVLATGAAFAQNKTSLNIVCNVTGAQVYVNGVMAGYTTPNFSFLVPMGNVQVRVQKNGWQTFETVVRAGGYPITLNVNLVAFGVQPQQPPVVIQPPRVFNYSLNVNSNVPGAQVFINGNQAGNTPFSATMAGGSYNVVVRAPGYTDFSQNVVVNGPVQINANLQPMGFQLAVGAANAQGAQVFINGNAVGQAPYNSLLPPGSYMVTIRAPGFADYSAQINLNGPQNVMATLVPLGSTWQLQINDRFLNRDIKGGHFTQAVLFIDGVEQHGTSGQITAGRHSIRLLTGGMAIETFLDVQPGVNYVIEPMLSLNIHQ